MEIYCEATKRFLFKIDIEEYYSKLKKMGIDVTFPIKIEIPCQKCKMIEVYEIYPTKYIHKFSYKRNVTNYK